MDKWARNKCNELYKIFILDNYAEVDKEPWEIC